MKIIRTVQISDVNMDSFDWGLEDRFAHPKECAEAAREMSRTFEAAVNMPGSTFESVRDAMDRVLDKYIKLGTREETTLLTLSSLLKKLYWFMGGD